MQTSQIEGRVIDSKKAYRPPSKARAYQQLARSNYHYLRSKKPTDPPIQFQGKDLTLVGGVLPTISKLLD